MDMGRREFLKGTAGVTAGVGAATGLAAGVDSASVERRDAVGSSAASWAFAPEEYGAKGDGTADDTAAVQRAINAAFDYAVANNNYAEVVFRPATYLIGGPLVEGGTTYGRSQLTIPVQPMSSRKLTIVFRGVRDASALPIWNQTVNSRNGAVLLSKDSGAGYDVTYGAASVFGGPTPEQGYGKGSNQWNNIMLVWDGVSVVIPSPANMGGINLRCMAEAVVPSALVTTNAHPPGLRGGSPAATFQVPTNNAAVGLQLPDTNNNDNSWVGNYSAEGLYYGMFVGEHTVVENCRMIYCVYPWLALSTSHWCVVKAASVEWCINGPDITDSHIDIMQIDFEDGSAPWSPSTYLTTTTSSNGSIRYMSNNFSTLIDQDKMPVPSQMPLVRFFDCRLGGGHRSDTPAIPASGTALLNPYYRDAMVTVSGDTVSGVSIDGASTGLTSGAFMVPSGKTITLTYTTTRASSWVGVAAPTWSWYLTSSTS
jgi:Pectate lyase superfamily protein